MKPTPIRRPKRSKRADVSEVLRYLRELEAYVQWLEGQLRTCREQQG